MDFGSNRVEEVRGLRDRTLCERAHLIELSQAIEKLDAILRDNAKGYCLEQLYAQVPDCLQGYVELVYDLNNQPSFRLIEPLLYKSSHYNSSLQSIVLSDISGDDRPFVLSTPRLGNEDSIELKLPFKSNQYDKLFCSKYKGASFSDICETFDLSGKRADKIRSFFTPQRPQSYRTYQGNGARWRYFGHACILLETRNTSILLDPVLSYTYESDISRFTYGDLPEVIDFVLITHNHQDHILFETLLQLRHRIRTVVVPRNGGGALQDPSLRLLLQQCGFKNVVEISEMETITIEEGSITAIPFFGEHGDLNVLTKAAYLLQVDGHKLLFAAEFLQCRAQTI